VQHKIKFSNGGVLPRFNGRFTFYNLHIYPYELQGVAAKDIITVDLEE
jgi:hypothetical protein